MTKFDCPTITTARFEEMSFGYDQDPNIFNEITFDLPMGKNILVTGQAANGQSTLLKLLAVLMQPTTGRFLLNGFNTSEMSFEEFLPFRMKIGYTFDYGGLFSNRNLHDNLILPLVYHKISDTRSASDEIVKMAEHFNFAKQLDRRPAEVSGGLRKLVCVLRAFVLHPELIVMDDPFTGIDTENSKRLIQMIADRRQTGELKHLFFTSRDEIWAERLGYEPLFIENGQPRFEDRSAVQVKKGVA